MANHAALTEYEHRFVCFLDILGFAAQVERSTSQVDHFRRLKQVFETVSVFQEDAEDFGVRIFAFSDSIVISSKRDFESLGCLIEFVEAIHQELWQLGILLRGGLDFGLLVHENDFVFGPALVAAYILEDRIAKYPRVLVSKDALSQFEVLARNEEERSYFSERLTQDGDGCVYLKVLGGLEQYFNSSDDQLKEDGQEICRNIASELGKNLQHSVNKPDVWEKYVWFAEHYNEFVATISHFAPGKVPIVDVFATPAAALAIQRKDLLPQIRTPKTKKDG